MSKKLFRVEVNVAATLYVRAESEDAATVLAQGVDAIVWFDPSDPRVCAAPFDSASLPDVSFSPIGTVTEIETDSIEVAV